MVCKQFPKVRFGHRWSWLVSGATHTVTSLTHGTFIMSRHTGFWIEKKEIYLKLVNFPCSLEMYKAVTWNSNSANQISEIWAQRCNTHAPREKQQLWASKKGKNKGVFIKHYDKDQTISQKKVQMHFTTNQLFVEMPVQSQLNYFNLVINDW